MYLRDAFKSHFEKNADVKYIDPSYLIRWGTPRGNERHHSPWVGAFFEGVHWARTLRFYNRRAQHGHWGMCKTTLRRAYRGLWAPTSLTTGPKANAPTKLAPSSLSSIQ